jgi:hypothetical protein
MSNTNPNPLAKHFRQPSIYIKLPSGGAFNDEDSLTIPENGELPVYAMTALDEITYKTADALFNGNAVADVIKSCVPAYKDAWQVSTVDLDMILVAIRIASYGHEMEFISKCPKCEEENNFSIDLRDIMERFKTPDFSKPVVNGDVEIHFRPLSYKEQNTSNTKQFADQRMLETLPSADIPEDQKLEMLQQAFHNISDLTLAAIAESISMIKAGDDIVVDKDHIEEYIRNCDNKAFAKIRNQIESIKKDAEIAPLHIACDDCKHEYDTPFTMNVANFFGSGS